jgi:hypothetical protein
MKLIEERKLPCRRVGNRRRVLLAYELTAEAQPPGLGH